MNNILEYLCREAERISENSLADIPATASEWSKYRSERLRKYFEMMGVNQYIDMEKRPPLNIRVTGEVKREGYAIRKIYFESLPKLYVTGNLYVPDIARSEPQPGVVYLCGHSTQQKTHYQFHPRHFAKLGFVALLVETIQMGEIKGHHHGVYSQGWFNWYSRGYTPAGVELWNATRAIDLLQQLPEVNPERIGATGISGGGATSWWVGAADERIKVVAPVCGTGTIASHVKDRTVDGHCDCMFFINTYLWDLSDVGALIAPRPLLIASADRDGIFSIKSIRDCYNRVKQVYRLLDAEENIMLVETPGPHSYHPKSRKAIFSWFLKHLKNMKTTPEEVSDLDESNPENEETLMVYGGDLPRDERVTTVHEYFVPKAESPKIETAEQLMKEREKIVKELLNKSFRHFPKPCDLNIERGMESQDSSSKYIRFWFTPEEGWRLKAILRIPIGQNPPHPCLIHIRGNTSPKVNPEEFLADFDPRWARFIVEVRGVNETAWGENLNWHVRRAAAITGRTTASMQIYDALRAVELCRTLPEIDQKNIALAARDEMSVIALYTALLDSGIKALILSNPPATQDVQSHPDGYGPAIEILNSLRFIDLPQICGLLWPAEILFLNNRPLEYMWAENLYRKLGLPGEIRHIHKDKGIPGIKYTLKTYRL
jgi:cephalosporin-C deacetylase-like acetyl esterase